MDKAGSCASLQTDLTKILNVSCNAFLIATLETYGFFYNVLNVMYGYLTYKKGRTKIYNSFINFSNLLIGVSLGSILGPPLFKGKEN